MTGEVFVTRARNVAAESRFYDFAFEGETFTIEPSLQKLEDLAKPIIERLLKADDLGVLSDDDRAALSIFGSSGNSVGQLEPDIEDVVARLYTRSR